MDADRPLENSVRHLSARLANTAQVLRAWAGAVDVEGLRDRRLRRAAASLDEAVWALTADSDDFKRLSSSGGPACTLHRDDDHAPGLRGRSEMISLVEFVSFLGTLRKTGVLRVESGDRDFVVELREGQVVYATSASIEPAHRVGELLVAAGAIRRDHLEEALGKVGDDELLGEALVRLGLIDPEARARALTLQSQHIFDRMHGVGSGFDFQFDEDARIVSRVDISLSVSHLLLEGARRLDEARVRREEEVGCEPGSVPEELERYRASLERRLLEGDVSLPVLPSATAQLVAMCWADEFDPEELKDHVTQDQALCAHLLRVANSASHAPVAPISSVQLAIARLGLDKLRELAMALTLRQEVFELPGWEDTLEELWRDAATMSGFAGIIGKRCGAGATRGGMLGLLQDVGKPVVLGLLREIARETGEELSAETARTLMDEYHPRVGSLLAEEWALPDWLADAVRHHHDYADAEEHRLEAMVGHLADRLNAWVHGRTGLEEEDLARLPVCAELGLGDSELRDLLEQTAQIRELVELVG